LLLLALLLRHSELIIFALTPSLLA
jgi:hypothetical protein